MLYDLPTGNFPLRVVTMFATSSGLSPMPLYDHNISKNLSHDLTLLSLNNHCQDFTNNKHI